MRIDQYYNQRGYNINNINPLETKFISAYLTIAVCGYSGCGKSTFINLSFGELVAKISKSCEDVTTKAAEYYLPIQDTGKKYDKLGQIRLIDFPGITAKDNCEKIVIPNIKSKIREYKKNKEYIDIAIIFLKNDIGRALEENCIDLIRFYAENNIKILFIIKKNS